MIGITGTLIALTMLAQNQRTAPTVNELAHKLTDDKVTRHDKIHAIIDELHRRFVYAPDPVQESFGPLRLTPDGHGMDVDDACLFVMALALSVDIPCRIVGARYGQRWTCFVGYEREGGGLAITDALRQHKVAEMDEHVLGPNPEGCE